MKRGLIVRGKVMDESDNPVKDAQVWADKLYYSALRKRRPMQKASSVFAISRRRCSVQCSGQRAEA